MLKMGLKRANEDFFCEASLTRDALGGAKARAEGATTAAAIKARETVFILNSIVVTVVLLVESEAAIWIL
jgi:hypothetical protein